MNKFYYWIIIIGGLILFLLTACYRNPLNVNIDNINIKLEIKRLDQDLFAIHPDSLMFYHSKLEKKYGEFLNIYTNLMINVGDPSKITYFEYLNKFTSDYTIRKIKDETNKKFNDLNWLQSELEKAFKHYQYYFPKKHIPTVYTCISGFNQSVITSDSILGISLDKYLGRDCSFYKRLEAPDYLKSRMVAHNLPVDCMIAWINMEFPFNDSVNNLLSYMIYKGKIQYFIDAIFPEMDDSLKLSYTKNQYKWAKKHEQSIWKYFVENKMLFSNSRLEIQKYTEIGPFTNNFGQKSPDRTGVWIGYKIIKSYMRNNPDVSLQELMKNDNYMHILNLSRYKP